LRNDEIMHNIEEGSKEATKKSEGTKETAPIPQLERLSDFVQLLRAPNPGPLTLTGTNSYLVGSGRTIAVIDPGPVLEEHLQRLVEVATAQQATISLILVTHGHPDHFPGAARLHELTGAPIAAFREASFQHDIALKDGQRLSVGEVTLIALYTPGHAPDHLCFYLEEEEALFTGDLILGSGTVVVAPPRGDMVAYLRSLYQLDQDWSHAETIYPGHGPAINNPVAKIREYIRHRSDRERQILASLRRGFTTIPQLVSDIYVETDKKLWPAAARQVLAHLDKLVAEGKVKASHSGFDPADAALLNPEGVFDPVVSAELGFKPGATTPTYHYTLV
jgi:glyoxylase-like metal-dependent hydrolase (beta-lactamase superfamily II)